MKIYLVIVNDYFYPNFGLQDVKGVFKNIDDAEKYIDTNYPPGRDDDNSVVHLWEIDTDSGKVEEK